MKTPDRVFIDTNILIYAVDSADPTKQTRAKEVVRNTREAGNGVISTQVLQEFFAVCTRKLKLSGLDGKRLTMPLYDFEIVSMTPELVESAMDLKILHQISFWDALIVAAAKYARCAKVFTEDMQNCSRVSGITLANPL